MRSGAIALLGLFALLAGWLLDEIVPGADLYVSGIWVLGGLLIGTALAMDYRRVGAALAGRRGRFGATTTVAVCLVAAILLVVNGISARAYHRFDLTGLAQFTLTSQTKDVLRALDSPVEVILVFSPRVPPQVGRFARDMLTEYQVHSDRLTVREIDPDLNPDQARRYGIDQWGARLGTVVFAGPEGHRRVVGPEIAAEAEHAFTAAILEITGMRRRTVYFLTGHGEGGPEAGFAEAAEALRTNLFRVAELDSEAVSTGGVPADAAVLIIAAPRDDLDTGEARAIRTYLAAGGGLLALLDPDPPEAFLRLLAPWVEIQDGIVVDPEAHVSPTRQVPLVPRERNAFALAETYFPGAAAVRPAANLPEEAEVTPLVWTSPASWLADDLASLGPPSDHPDAVRSRALGALILAGEGRLAVIGDSDFTTDRHFHNGDNAGLFLGTVGWLSAEARVISIDRKVLPSRRLLLSGGEARFLNLTGIGLMPLAVLIVGGVLWWRRRAS